MADETSPFVLDPNKLDGYPSVDTLPDLGWPNEITDSSVRQYVYGSFSDIGNTESAYGYPNYGSKSEFINIEMPYQIQDETCRTYIYGHFTDIGNTESAYGYPNYGNKSEFINIEMPYQIQDKTCREYVYGNFTDIDSNISEIKYPIFDNALEYYETFGAIYDTEVNKLVIPKTVTLIADYAFYRSNNIKKVKIASECLYYEHSFPEDCKIEFYEEDE